MLASCGPWRFMTTAIFRFIKLDNLHLIWLTWFALWQLNGLQCEMHQIPQIVQRSSMFCAPHRLPPYPFLPDRLQNQLQGCGESSD